MDASQQIAANQSQITANQNQINSAQNRISNNNAKISRLKSAKETVLSIKSEVKALKKRDKAIVHGSYNWKGDHYTVFRDTLGEGILADDEAFIDSLDSAAATIQREITRLENENYSQQGWIGQLWAAINTLVDEINNLIE